MIFEKMTTSLSVLHRNMSVGAKAITLAIGTKLAGVEHQRNVYKLGYGTARLLPKQTKAPWVQSWMAFSTGATLFRLR